MDILFATYSAQPALTPSDALAAEALRTRGQRVEGRPWDAIAPAADPASLVGLRSAWDYHLHPARFRAWIGGFDPGKHGLWNPAATVLWNMDKVYLRELETLGIPIPRTQWLEPRQSINLPALFAATGWPRAVLKPGPTLRRFGERVLKAVPLPWLYARVDVVESARGPLLMELELI